MPATESNVAEAPVKRGTYKKRLDANGQPVKRVHWTSTPAGKRRMSILQKEYHAKKKALEAATKNGHTEPSRAETLIGELTANGHVPADDGKTTGKVARRSTYRLAANMAVKSGDVELLYKAIGHAMVMEAIANMKMGGGL